MKIESQCYDIYKKAFEEDEFAIKLFDTCFEYCEYLIKGTSIVSILFMLPCDILIDHNTYSSKYMFAVATDENFRGNGYMTELINRTKEKYRNDIIFLKPANDELMKFYKNLDFITITAQKCRKGDIRVVLSDKFYNLSNDITSETNEKYNLMYFFKEKIHLNGINFADTME